jgi:hypothetical protein
MTELERRQSQHRPFHKHEAKILADTEHLKVPVIDGENHSPNMEVVLMLTNVRTDNE